MGIVKEKTMPSTKVPVEISCSECDSEFRLWIPEDLLPDWENGAVISCVKCGAQHKIERGADGLEASPVAPEETKKKKKKKKAAMEASPEPEDEEDEQEEELEEAQEGIVDTVLLIEDDKLSRRQAEDTIKDAGIRFITVKNSAEALDMIEKEEINLIVTDLYLKKPNDPDTMLDGEDLLNKVVALGLTIPSIIITGKDLLDEMILDPKWFEMHVKAFIQKGNPFWADDLKLKIKEVLYKD